MFEAGILLFLVENKKNTHIIENKIISISFQISFVSGKVPSEVISHQPVIKRNASKPNLPLLIKISFNYEEIKMHTLLKGCFIKCQQCKWDCC